MSCRALRSADERCRRRRLGRVAGAAAQLAGSCGELASSLCANFFQLGTRIAMGLRALLALCATPLVAGFGGLTYLRSIEDIEELHAPTVDTEGVQIEGVYDGLLHTHLSPLDAVDAQNNKIGTVYEFKHVEAGPVTTINLYEGHFPTPPPPSPASPVATSTPTCPPAPRACRSLARSRRSR